jgi:hypothetical protein
MRGRWPAVAPFLLALLALPVGCTSPPDLPPPPSAAPAEAPDAEVYRRADSERAERLARQVEQLRAELEHAEQTLVAVESGLRGTQSRADAVSAIAEAAVEVSRAAERAGWRPDDLREARAKLEEAERQVDAGHFGSAIFFASRAERIAERVLSEAKNVAAARDVRFVGGRRVNLRGGPSTEDPVLEVLVHGTPVYPERQQGDWVLVRSAPGAVGWIHATMLRDREP